MHTITTTIQNLFKAIEIKENKSFQLFEAYDIQSMIKIQDYNGNWQSIPTIILKQDYIIEIEMENGDILKVGRNHIFIKNKNKPTTDICNTTPAYKLSIGDEFYTIDNKIVKIKNIIKRNYLQNIYDLQINSDKPWYTTPDGYIHHNSGKSFVAYLLTQAYSKSKILFIFNAIDLLLQTREMFISYGMNPQDISIIQGANFIDDGRVILLSEDSYLNATHLFPEITIVIADEVHSTGRDATSQKIIYSCQNAAVHIGLSATPDKLDSTYEQMKLYGNIGPIIYEKEFIDQMNAGVLAQTKVQLYAYPGKRIDIVNSWADMYKTTEVLKTTEDQSRAIDEGFTLIEKDGEVHGRKFIGYGDEYTHMVNNPERNEKIVSIINGFLAQGKRVLGIFTRIEHGNILSKMIPDSLLVSGKDSVRERKLIENQLKKDQGTVVFSSNVWSQGKDLPFIDIYVNCGGGVSSIRTIQKAGRVVRQSHETNKTEAIICDLIDDCLSPLGKSQSNKRLKIYTDLQLPIEVFP